MSSVEKLRASIPIPVTRQALITLLSEASELEHQLLCMYLFTAYSLKTSADEGGMDPAQAQQARGWRGAISHVAVQEMLHLSLASNLLAAIGSGAHLTRPNLPQVASRYYPPDFAMTLERFSAERMHWLICFEAFDAEGPHCDQLDLGCPPPGTAPPDPALLARRAADAMTVGRMYRRIGEMFFLLCDELGEAGVFTGPPSAQLTDASVTALFGYATRDGQPVPLLNPVFDLRSALTAINTIVVQGEGDVAEWQEFVHQWGKHLHPPFDPPAIAGPSHEETFCQVRRQYLAALAADPAFDPVRNVVSNPYPRGFVPADAGSGITIFDNPGAIATANLYNGIYDLMMKMLGRAFGHTEESSFALASLVQDTIRMMVYVLSDLGDRLTQLPAFVNDDGRRAGPSFTLDRTQQFLPHMDAAWRYFAEQLTNLSNTARQLSHANDVAARTFVPRDVTARRSRPRGASKPMRHMAETQGSAYFTSIADLLEFLSFRMQQVLEDDLLGIERLELHACYGLNSCQGHGIAGSGTTAGDGLCATAHPHVCGGFNECRGQGGCGSEPEFAPDNLAWQADFQDHPNENLCRTWGACGAPVLPGTINTLGRNGPVEPFTDPSIRDRAQGDVWKFARILFEQRMAAKGVTPAPPPDIPGVDTKVP